jgi:ssDNA-binding Zn-finger/Zn-ribbon topoisomerase 1
MHGGTKSHMKPLKIEDYTQKPSGTVIDNKEIQTCPKCGKQGLVDRKDGIIYFVHVTTIESGENQMVIYKNDQCAFRIKSAQPVAEDSKPHE